jgi:uncharacterized membrane protein
MTAVPRNEPIWARTLAALRTPTEVKAPVAVVISTQLLALVGLGIAIYLTYVHFTGTQALVCSNTGGVNCIKVTTSGESRFLGMPVAVLGLFQYLVMAGLCSPWAWRSRRREVHLARLVFSVVGMAFVIWLIAAEALIIKAICEWCTGVHIVTFILFILIVRTVPEMLGWTATDP